MFPNTLWIGGTRKHFLDGEKSLLFKVYKKVEVSTTKNLVFYFGFWFQFIQWIEHKSMYLSLQLASLLGKRNHVMKRHYIVIGQLTLIPTFRKFDTKTALSHKVNTKKVLDLPYSTLQNKRNPTFISFWTLGAKFIQGAIFLPFFPGVT